MHLFTLAIYYLLQNFRCFLLSRNAWSIRNYSIMTIFVLFFCALLFIIEDSETLESAKSPRKFRTWPTKTDIHAVTQTYSMLRMLFCDVYFSFGLFFIRIRWIEPYSFQPLHFSLELNSWMSTCCRRCWLWCWSYEYPLSAATRSAAFFGKQEKNTPTTTQIHKRARSFDKNFLVYDKSKHFDWIFLEEKTKKIDNSQNSVLKITLDFYWITSILFIYSELSFKFQEYSHFEAKKYCTIFFLISSNCTN